MPEVAIVAVILPLFLVESNEPVEHHGILQYFEGCELHGCLVVSQGVDGGVGGVAGVLSSLVQSNVEDESGEEVAGVGHGVRLISEHITTSFPPV